MFSYSFGDRQAAVQRHHGIDELLVGVVAAIGEQGFEMGESVLFTESEVACRLPDDRIAMGRCQRSTVRRRCRKMPAVSPEALKQNDRDELLFAVQ